MILLKDFNGNLYIQGENLALIFESWQTRCESSNVRFIYEYDNGGVLYVIDASRKKVKLFDWDSGDSHVANEEYMEGIFRLFIDAGMLPETECE